MADDREKSATDRTTAGNESIADRPGWPDDGCRRARTCPSRRATRRSRMARSSACLNREAFPAAAGALGVGVGEDEAGGEIVLDPVHRRADQVEDRAAVDEQRAAGRVDPLVERLGVGDVIDRIGEARTAAARGRQLDPDRVGGRASPSARRCGHGAVGVRLQRRGALARSVVAITLGDHPAPSSGRGLIRAFPVRACLVRHLLRIPWRIPDEVDVGDRRCRAPRRRASRPRRASTRRPGNAAWSASSSPPPGPSSVTSTP